MRRVKRSAPGSKPSLVLGLGIIGVSAANVALMLFGCGVDKDHLPPPPSQQAPPTRGSSGASTTGAGSGPSSACECAAALYAGGDAKCGDCMSALVAPGKACASAWTACGATSACEQLVACAGTCGSRGGGDVTRCINQCILPLDRDEAHKTFAALLECACGACPACTYGGAVSCPASEPDAGDGNGDGGAEDGPFDADAMEEGGSSRGDDKIAR